MTEEAVDSEPTRIVSLKPPAGNSQFRITRVSPAYWRVTIDHPPFNPGPRKD